MAEKSAQTETAASAIPAADGASCPLVDPRTRQELIARAAYFRAQERGFEPGHELEDWRAAEVEIDTVLNLNTQT